MHSPPGDVDLYVSASWDARPIVAPSCPSNCFSIACCIYVVISFSLASSSAGSEDLLVPHETVRSLCAGRDSAPGSTNPCYLVVGVVGSASFIRSTEQQQRQGLGLGRELGHYMTEPAVSASQRAATLFANNTSSSSSGNGEPSSITERDVSSSRRVLPAAEASTYTITSSFQSSTVQLVTGQPARATARFDPLLPSSPPSRSVNTYFIRIFNTLQPVLVAMASRAGSALYYRYSVASPGADVVLAVTPLYGDPDLYVSLAPNYFPSRSNYTWIAAAYETDVLTIQVDARHFFIVVITIHFEHTYSRQLQLPVT